MPASPERAGAVVAARERPGPVVAAHVRDFFAEERNRAVLAALQACGVSWPEGTPVLSVKSGPLSGETLVITGTLASKGIVQVQVTVAVPAPAANRPVAQPV